MNLLPHTLPVYVLGLIFIAIALLSIHGTAAGQVAPQKPVSQSLPETKSISSDSLSKYTDSSYNRLLRRIKAEKRKTQRNGEQYIYNLTHPVLPGYNGPKRIFDKTLVHLDGGYINYGFNYRSNIDTPYAEKDIVQHNLIAGLHVTVAGILPLQVTWLERRSNSKVFRNISALQVSFSGTAFRNQLQATAQKRLEALAAHPPDSLLEQLYALKSQQLTRKRQWLSSPFTLQQLVQSNEILQVPHITDDRSLPDSVNAQKADSMKQKAAIFIDQYKKAQKEYDVLTRQTDSLKQVYEQSRQKITGLRQWASGQAPDAAARQQALSPGYNWLYDLKNFSLGRTPVNYSELTVKNLTLNGINIEYNSWYYFAVAAGAIDYRFRDFSVSTLQAPQHFYIVRAGIGRLQRNYFILSAYQGEKQLFSGNGNSSGVTAIHVSGFSAEAKLQISKNVFIAGELAQSVAPDYKDSPPKTASRFNFSDKASQAIALRFSSWWPKTQSRIEGTYKKTGANFQSFSSFQTNSALDAWNIKAEQSLFNRQLRFTAALRKNEYSNPYLVQNYKSNTVFSSVTATLRIRKWPVVTLGYLPMSQLTVLDNQVLENRFQTLNASLYHLYKIGGIRAATNILLNKFYNSSSDTGFLYYNATNLYATQDFFFHAFDARMAISTTRNNSYALNVLEGGIRFHVSSALTLGIGSKVNEFNKQETKVGAYLNAGIRVGKQDMIYLDYERGFLPGNNKTLVRNEMGNVQFIKTFTFR